MDKPREMNEDANYLTNYLNYLRRWDLEDVHTINDFTRRFAPRTDEIIAEELGNLHVKGFTEHYDNVQNLLSLNELSRDGYKYFTNGETADVTSGLKLHIKDRYDLDMSTKDIKTLLYNEHMKDLNVLATQWDKKGTISKLLNMVPIQAITAGYHLTRIESPEAMTTGLVNDLIVPLATFELGGKLGVTLGTSISKFAVGGVGEGLLNFAGGTAGNIAAEKVLNGIGTDIIYGKAKEAIGLDPETHDSIDWNLIFAGAGMVATGKGIHKIRKPMKELGGSAFKNIRKIFKAAL